MCSCLIVAGPEHDAGVREAFEGGDRGDGRAGMTHSFGAIDNGIKKWAKGFVISLPGTRKG